MKRNTVINIEDKLIEELLNIGYTKNDINNSHILNGIKNGQKIKDIVKTMKSSECTQKTLDILMAQFKLINCNYEDFLSGDNGTLKNIAVKYLLKLSSIDRKNKISNDLYKKFENLYDSKETKWLKKIIDLKKLEKIFNGTPSICTVCQSCCIELTDRDHFLPRSRFPLLSISRTNIVFVCSICNQKYKKHTVPKLPIMLPQNCEGNLMQKYLKFSYDASGNFKVIPEARTSQTIFYENKINNLINLYRLNDRFNTDDMRELIDRDVINIRSRVLHWSKNTAPKKIDILKINDMIYRKQEEYIKEMYDNLWNNQYVKFRVFGIRQHIKMYKSTLSYSIYTESLSRK